MADGINVTEAGLAEALAPFLAPGVKVTLRTSYDDSTGYAYEGITLSLDGAEVSLFADGDALCSFFTM